MNCDRVQDLILLFLAGELAAEEAELLRPHLLGCAACTRSMSETRRMLRALDEVTQLEASDETDRRTAASVRLGLKARAGRPINRLAAAPVASWMSSAIVMLMVCFALRWYEGEIPDQPYDLSGVQPPVVIEPEAPVFPPLTAVDAALDGISARIAEARPGAGADDTEGVELAEGASDADAAPLTWSESLDGLQQQAAMWEWHVTVSRPEPWTESVADLRERLDQLASGLDEG